MAEVSIRDLRNHGGEIIQRAGRGEEITITRSGQPVAELRALPRRALSPDRLVARWRSLPPIDGDTLRADVDRVLDSRL